MSPPRVRPRFELELDDDPDRVMERLRSRLPGCRHCTGVSAGRHAELFVPDAERRFFSPWLSVTAYERDGGAHVRGRFGPHPSLWTAYMAGFFGLGTLLVIAITWGYAQWALSRSPWALWGAAAVAGLAALLYLVSLIGQRLGDDQMDTLQRGFEALIGPREPPEEPGD